MVSMKPAGRRGKELFLGMISGGTMSDRIVARHGDAIDTGVLAHSVADNYHWDTTPMRGAHGAPSEGETRLAEPGVVALDWWLSPVKRDIATGLISGIYEEIVSGVNYYFPSTTTIVPDGYSCFFLSFPR
jgi:hypothetical protein